ncbi:hypothetical protein DFQ14_104225 [Halopolyspora algeriensis]|uniref:Uncharacterized protein n=1 Tax=Halopolyspora algeriensis TaxID=1500506 RepID=A0A368VTW8_9ACTN|nr:hypothetical protein [Halopolyspora algeriensis]RCW44636.1 hypothetical protein DFQ14_104225 [Halopolyspora algeriensis]TQM55997.1 hypothetical protein FHU43_0775 [Halopolyspora algeriensis]
MVDQSQSPVKDKNYNLVTVLQNLLQQSWHLQTYLEDAQNQNDTELAEWLSQLQQENLRAGERGKKLLHARLQQENG